MILDEYLKSSGDATAVPFTNDLDMADKQNLGKHPSRKSPWTTEDLVEDLTEKVIRSLSESVLLEFSYQEVKLLSAHWIRRLVSASARIYSALALMNSESIQGTIFTRSTSNTSYLRVSDSALAIRAFDSPLYRENLATLYIEEAFPDLSRKLEVCNDEISEGQEVYRRDTPSSSLKVKVFNWLIVPLEKINSHAKFFFFNTYLPWHVDAKTLLRLGGPPQFWGARSRSTQNWAVEERESRFSSFSLGDSGFEKCLEKAICFTIPDSFLDSLESAKKQIANNRWPNKPKVIFTSNAFDTDDLFKKYVILKRRSGSKYVVGQHGNNYGTAKSAKETIEELTSDYFLTWGWNKLDGSSDHMPTFLIKDPSRVSATRRRSGRLVLAQISRDWDVHLTDPFIRHATYLESQIVFAKSLKPHVQNNLSVRFHAETEVPDFGEKQVWKSYFPKVPARVFPRSLNQQLSSCRLVVFSYDSTGILEQLSRNFPTVAFWGGGLGHLIEEAKPYYRRLVDAKIIFFSPEEAAQHVNRVWEDVDSWWLSREVQSAREEFVLRYARKDPRPSKTLSKIIKSVV